MTKISKLYYRLQPKLQLKQMMLLLSQKPP